MTSSSRWCRRPRGRPSRRRRRVFVLERVDTHERRGGQPALEDLGGAGLVRASDPADRRAGSDAGDRGVALPAGALRAVAGGADSGFSWRERACLSDEAMSCARLALGNAARALYLASPEGAEVRAEVDAFVAAALGAGGGRFAGRAVATAPGASRDPPRRGRGGAGRGGDVGGWSSSRRAASAGRSSASSRSRRSATGAGRERSRSTCR